MPQTRSLPANCVSGVARMQMGTEVLQAAERDVGTCLALALLLDVLASIQLPAFTALRCLAAGAASSRMKRNRALPPAGEAGHLLWVADPSQPDLGSRPTDLAEALTLREQQGQIEVGGAAQHCDFVKFVSAMPLAHELRRRPLWSRVPTPCPGFAR